MSEIAARLKKARVAPVVRTRSERNARHGVALLAEEGFTIFEITLTTPGAMSIIADLAREPGLCIGVGTVLRPAQAAQAIDRGAAFVVSPVTVPGLIDEARRAGAPVALGAATPSEVFHAHDAGADFVKVFPARQLGGPGYLRALGSVFPEIPLMPTGGIEPDDMQAYLDAGAVCLGMGGNLVSEAALESGDDRAIRAAARTVLDLLRP